MACANGVLKIYNLSPSGELLRLEGPKDWSDVGFSHDGQRLYAGNGDINVWTIGNPADLSFGRQLTLMESIGDDEHYFHFHPDGRRMVTSSIVEKPKIIDGDTGEVVGILEVHRDSVWSVAYSPDGTRFATGSNDLTVRIWNTESTEQPHVLTGHSEQVSRTIFSPDGKLLASVSMNESLKLWDVYTGQLLTTVQQADWLWGVDFSPDGRYLVTAGNEPVIRMWDVEHLTDGQEITEGKQFSGHAATILDVIFSPDGERLAPASFDNTVKVWEVATGRELLTLRGHEGTVDSVAFSPDGQRLASTSWDKTILVYALGLEELIALARSHVTRSLTDKECRQYLHLDACPVNSNS